jgi:hypothetical protein
VLGRPDDVRGCLDEKDIRTVNFTIGCPFIHPFYWDLFIHPCYWGSVNDQRVLRRSGLWQKVVHRGLMNVDAGY